MYILKYEVCFSILENSAHDKVVEHWYLSVEKEHEININMSQACFVISRSSGDVPLLDE